MSVCSAKLIEVVKQSLFHARICLLYIYLNVNRNTKNTPNENKSNANTNKKGQQEPVDSEQKVIEGTTGRILLPKLKFM